jgi:ribosome-associated protein
MSKVQGAQQTARLLDAVIEGIQEVKGKDIVHLDLQALPNSVSQHFVVCHGDSHTQVEAIADSVEKLAKDKAGEKPWHVEGRSNGEWVLLDYVDIVVHVFHRERRGFYALEDLWADAVRMSYENVA